jgi:small-conductance mechanosensitive channel
VTEWDIGRGAIVLAAGVLGYCALRRVGQRLPLLLTRRALPGATHPDPALARVVALVVLPATLALWGAVLWAASEPVAPLRRARAAVVQAVLVGLARPLFTVSERGYSLVDLLVLPACLGFLWVAAGAVTRVVESRLRRRAGTEHGGHETLGMLVRYAATLLGGLVVLQTWGVDVRTLALVGSVVGVGIGFGLQNLANNFVSGVVLSVERPIKPGDYVRVGEFQGTVERIGARSTEIVTRDRVSILVPNSRLLETEVVNWTHGDPHCRVSVPVGVAYGTDLRLAQRALLEAARNHPDVLADPPPRVDLRRFADSAVELELEVFTRDPRRQLDLVSDLNFRVEAALRRHGMTIPFPQRDLHLRSPELAVLVEALARRHFAPDELAAAAAAVAARAPRVADAGADGPDGQRVWDDEALGALVARMRGAGGVRIADRRHLLNVYPRCLVGREAVDWLCAHEGLTRQAAVELGQRLVARGALHHVLDEHPFRDGNFYYRFRADDAAGGTEGRPFARGSRPDDSIAVGPRLCGPGPGG